MERPPGYRPSGWWVSGSASSSRRSWLTTMRSVRRRPRSTATDGAACQVASIGKQMQTATMTGSTGAGASSRAAATMSPAHNSAVSSVDAHVKTACRLVGSVCARMAQWWYYRRSPTGKRAPPPCLVVHGPLCGVRLVDREAVHHDQADGEHAKRPEREGSAD